MTFYINESRSTQHRGEAEQDDELKKYFFIDPENTPEEANAIIAKWMNDQAEVLLRQYVQN